MPLYVGAAAGAVSLAWYLLVMRRGRRVGGQRSVARALHGPALSDGLASPGDADSDAKLRELWGGPAPKHFDTALADWPRRFPAGAGRLAVVTGGAAGIGFYVAKLLAAQGFTVVVPARPGFEHEAAGAAASIAAALGPGADGAARVVVPKAALDLGSLASTRAFAAEVRSLCYKNARKQGRAGGGLALLCLNAGRGGSKGDPRALTADGLEAIVQVNALGHFLLTAELLPELRRAAAAIIICLTRHGGSGPKMLSLLMADVDYATAGPRIGFCWVVVAQAPSAGVFRSGPRVPDRRFFSFPIAVVAEWSARRFCYPLSLFTDVDSARPRNCRGNGTV